MSYVTAEEIIALLDQRKTQVKASPYLIATISVEGNIITTEWKEKVEAEFTSVI